MRLLRMLKKRYLSSHNLFNSIIICLPVLPMTSLHPIQIVVLNDERNWRSGLRVRLLNSCMAKGGKGKKGGHETDVHGEEDVSTSDQPNDKHSEETSQPSDAIGEHVSEESTGDT
uniref:Uncharacterized protein n=1 Tax=Aegilops tauschii subsp. strangulata TaxID=200361 RepID=A0A453HFL2_AEGTS